MRKVAFSILAIIIIGALVAINFLPKHDSSVVKKVRRINVVAAENQYGNIAKLIGKNNVSVTNIISNADGDPHTFISSVKNAKLIAQADVIIYNGADYDSWINSIIKNNDHAVVIKVQDLLKFQETPRFGINPHLWYDPDTFPALATKLKEVFTNLDSKDASLYEKNYEIFNHKYEKVNNLVKDIKDQSAGTPVTATEPVFGYMADALGLDMKGLAFQWVIMNDSEPSPKMMIDYQKLLKNKEVKALFYNKQVTDKTTENILKLAKENNIPIIGVTETMPVDTDAIQWMVDTLETTQAALPKTTI